MNNDQNINNNENSNNNLFIQNNNINATPDLQQSTINNQLEQPIMQPINPMPPVQPINPVEEEQPIIQPMSPIQQELPVVQSVNNVQPQQPINNVTESKKINKKILFIIPIIIIILGIVAYFCFFKGEKSTNDEDLSLIFDPNKPIVIEKDGKYGYIDSNGKTIIEPTYLSASEFNGNYAIVITEKSSYEKTYQIINKSGEALITVTSYYEPKYYSEYDIWVIDGHLYNSKLEMISDENIDITYVEYGYLTYEDDENSESGIIDYTGKKILTWSGSSIYMSISESNYDSDDLYAKLKSYSTPEREVVVSLKSGEILFKIEDLDKYYMSLDDDGIFYYYEKGNYKTTKYLYFRDGKLQYESSEYLYGLEVYDYENNILKLDYGYSYEDNGKSQRYYYYDIKNQQILDEEPELSDNTKTEEMDTMLYKYGYQIFSISDKDTSGIMNKNKVIIPAEYDKIEFLNINLFNYIKQEKNQSLALLEKDDKTILMNIKNKKVIYTFDAKYVYDYYYSTFLKATIYDEKEKVKGYIIYNLLTGATMEVEDKDCTVNSNYIEIKDKTSTIYYNTKLEKIYEE